MFVRRQVKATVFHFLTTPNSFLVINADKLELTTYSSPASLHRPELSIKYYTEHPLMTKALLVKPADLLSFGLAVTYIRFTN